jgi:hypothetical protein
MRINWLFRLFAVLAVASLPACESSTDAEPSLSGSYVLRTVAGESLPTVLSTNEFYEFRVLADTLRLTPGGTGTLSGVEQARSLTPSLPDEEPESVTIQFHYQVSGANEIAIAFDCPDNGNCVAPPHMTARLTNTGLQVSWAPSLGGRNPMVFVAISEP